MDMSILNKASQELIKGLSLAEKAAPKETKEETVKTSKAASALAVAYEAARNAVEFRDEHLIRQAAINRILKRRLLLQQTSKKLASLLIKELIWARYLADGTVPVSRVEEIAKIIDKYRLTINQVSSTRKNRQVEWLLGIASCEIEEKLVFNPVPQILLNFVYQSLSPRLDFTEADNEIKAIQIYIAVERGFAKNSEIFIGYRLLKVFLPEWKKTTSPTPELIIKLTKSYKSIQIQLNHPLKEPLRRAVVKISPPFNLIREVIEKYPSDFSEITTNPETFSQEALTLLEEKYQQTQEKLTRASQRSIIYIFLTKMIFGILLELPFDFWLGKPNYLALSINAIFPPFLMFLLNIGVKPPDEENSHKMIAKIKEYLYQEPSEGQAKEIKQITYKGKIQTSFYWLYVVSFILIFAGIIYLLNFIGFSPVSQIIFLFFLSIVSFFAFRVRGLAKDYLLQEEERVGFLTSFKDFIFLPIIRVGQWLSDKIAYLNILSFILDFIIEAPLKTFLEVMEEWIHFVRVKKEEIIG